MLHVRDVPAYVTAMLFVPTEATSSQVTSTPTEPAALRVEGLKVNVLNTHSISPLCQDSSEFTNISSRYSSSHCIRNKQNKATTSYRCLLC